MFYITPNNHVSRTNNIIQSTTSNNNINMPTTISTRVTKSINTILKYLEIDILHYYSFYWQQYRSLSSPSTTSRAITTSFLPLSGCDDITDLINNTKDGNNNNYLNCLMQEEEQYYSDDTDHYHGRRDYQDKSSLFLLLFKLFIVLIFWIQTLLSTPICLSTIILVIYPMITLMRNSSSHNNITPNIEKNNNKNNQYNNHNLPSSEITPNQHNQQQKQYQKNSLSLSHTLIFLLLRIIVHFVVEYYILHYTGVLILHVLTTLYYSISGRFVNMLKLSTPLHTIWTGNKTTEMVIKKENENQQTEKEINDVNDIKQQQQQLIQDYNNSIPEPKYTIESFSFSNDIELTFFVSFVFIIMLLSIIYSPLFLTTICVYTTLRVIYTVLNTLIFKKLL
eukprot:UN04644